MLGNYGTQRVLDTSATTLRELKIFLRCISLPLVDSSAAFPLWFMKSSRDYANGGRQLRAAMDASCRGGVKRALCLAPLNTSLGQVILFTLM